MNSGNKSNFIANVDRLIELNKASMELANNLKVNAIQSPEGRDINLFPSVIKERRKELEMSIDEVAELSGISSSTYKNVELNKVSPKLNTMMNIATVLGLRLCIQ